MNHYEKLARLVKAFKLTGTSRFAGLSTDELGMFTEDQWASLSMVAKVNPPSEKTRKMVIDMMAMDS
jgi:hypothetical protein